MIFRQAVIVNKFVLAFLLHSNKRRDKFRQLKEIKPMKSELIVDVQPKEVSIALTEEGRLVSLQKESRDLAYAVGDIYLAKVKKLMPGLNAAFVNVGYEKDAFLHYLDLGSHFSTYSSFVQQLLEDKKRIPQQHSQQSKKSVPNMFP